MKKIGLISDTHGHFDVKLKKYFNHVDEIWHVGDVGDFSVIEKLTELALVKGVYGNIDGTTVRGHFPSNNRFLCEQVDVWMTHIGGYPNKYDIRIRDEIRKNPPRLFITGHSHILKVMYDKKLDLIHMNPGAAGIFGFHKVKTIIRFEIDGSKIENVEVVELGPKAKLS